MNVSNSKVIHKGEHPRQHTETNNQKRARESVGEGRAGDGTFQATMSPIVKHNREKTPRQEIKSGPTKGPEKEEQEEEQFKQ